MGSNYILERSHWLQCRELIGVSKRADRPARGCSDINMVARVYKKVTLRIQNQPDLEDSLYKERGISLGNLKSPPPSSGFLSCSNLQ